MLLHPTTERRKEAIRKSLCINRHESVATTERDGFGAKRAQHLAHEIAGDGRVLEDPDFEASKRAGRKQGYTALEIGFQSDVVFIDTPEGRIGDVVGGEGSNDTQFVRLADLAGRRVEFEAIAISRDMAAGNHYGGAVRCH